MDNLSSNGVETQGVETQDDVPSIAQLEQWLTRDLGTCIQFLKALHDDKDLRMQMATFLQGRISNFKNRPDPRQTDLFSKGPKVFK